MSSNKLNYLPCHQQQLPFLFLALVSILKFQWFDSRMIGIGPICQGRTTGYFYNKGDTNQLAVLFDPNYKTKSKIKRITNTIKSRVGSYNWLTSCFVLSWLLPAPCWIANNSLIVSDTLLVYSSHTHIQIHNIYIYIYKYNTNKGVFNTAVYTPNLFSWFGIFYYTLRIFYTSYRCSHELGNRTVGECLSKIFSFLLTSK